MSGYRPQGRGDMAGSINPYLADNPGSLEDRLLDARAATDKLPIICKVKEPCLRTKSSGIGSPSRLVCIRFLMLQQLQ